MPTKDSPPGTLELWGNYGSLTVDRYDGRVTSYTPSHDDPPEYRDIVRFDLTEARQFYGPAFDRVQRCDILAVGFWTAAGEYVAAEDDWRHAHPLPA